MSTQQNGVQFTAHETGTYRFTYVDGAYAQGPPMPVAPNQNAWLTGFLIFDGQTPDFSGKDALGRNMVNLERNIARVADHGYEATPEAARAAALENPSVDIELRASQIVTLVCIDAKDYFYDNVGSVTVLVSYVR